MSSTDELAPRGASPDPSAQKRTPDEWARALFPRAPSGRNHPELWRHGAAAALHRWKEDEHHYGAQIQLTRAEYDAAIAGALKPVPEPHPAALSRQARRG